VKSLARSLDLKIEEHYSSEFDFKGYSIKTLTPKKLAIVKAEAEKMMLPADDMTLLQELIKLRALTKHKNEGYDLDLLLETLVNKLSKYPEDAVIKALDRIVDKSQWWPSWFEIKKEVEYHCKYRMALLNAINKQYKDTEEKELKSFLKSIPIQDAIQ
jgi:hypothetical protein